MTFSRQTALLRRFGTMVVMLHLVTASTVLAEDELARDSTHLQELLQEVRAFLPSGWRAEITPDVPREITLPWRQNMDVPCLAVWRIEKTLGEPIYPGMPGRAAGEEPPYEPVQLCFQLTFTKFISLDDYRRAARGNADRQRQRERFFRRFLGAQPRAYKGNFPPPPMYINAETPEQKELVRQYLLLWARTELTKLPTHYYRTLSFVFESQYVKLKERTIAAEHEQLRKDILNIVSAYPEGTDE